MTTTASQLNELEKLVTNTQKYTKKMQSYNELFQDQYFRAEKVLFIAESLKAKRDAKDLGQLNWAIRDLKYSMSELKGLMKEYQQIKNDEDKTKYQVREQQKINLKKSKIAAYQIKSSIAAKTTGRATQVNSRNTALIYEQSIEMHNTQLEMLEKIAISNRLLAEQIENERFKEAQLKKAYGVNKK